jgi:hypothetical protein
METNQLSYYLIDLMKSYINKEGLLKEKASELVMQIGMAIDRAKIANQPTTELEYLQDTALWLKTQIGNE